MSMRSWAVKDMAKLKEAPQPQMFQDIFGDYVGQVGEVYYVEPPPKDRKALLDPVVCLKFTDGTCLCTTAKRLE
ncbi:MAG TPA: hypothetical protein VHP58_00715 [Alphaproteobacteria bacterium]|nr:hypothetical protein [Alphaproteobacteria bacterium]